jgi:hypothetical protein
VTLHNGAFWFVQITWFCYRSEITEASTGYACGWDAEENKCVQQFGVKII